MVEASGTSGRERLSISGRLGFIKGNTLASDEFQMMIEDTKDLCLFC